MKWGSKIGKALTVVSAIVLVAALICYRAGYFRFAVTSVPPTKPQIIANDVSPRAESESPFSRASAANEHLFTSSTVTLPSFHLQFGNFPVAPQIMSSSKSGAVLPSRGLENVATNSSLENSPLFGRAKVDWRSSASSETVIFVYPAKQENFVNLAAMAISVGVGFFFLVAVFRPLELAFPAKPGQRFFRPEWLTDLCFFLGQYLVWNGIVFWLLIRFGGWIQRIEPLGFHAVAGQPWWRQAVEVVLLSDFIIYWGHRLQHHVGFLWRFHSIHHSAEHLDWLAAHREHPIDTLYTVGLINLPAFILGFPLATIIGLITFRGIWAIYIHSNVRLPIRPLRWLIGAPELHHWHHDRARDAGNYANISPLMDLLFGTYVCPNHEPAGFGIEEPISRNYLGQMLHPFRRIRQGVTKDAGKISDTESLPLQQIDG